jgi:hypothetical protein
LALPFSESRFKLGTRDWIAVGAEMAIGPAFLKIGYAIPGMVFWSAAVFYFAWCALVVPVLILIADHLKLLT